MHFSHFAKLSAVFTVYSGKQLFIVKMATCLFAVQTIKHLQTSFIEWIHLIFKRFSLRQLCFQLELIYYFTYFYIVVPSNICMLLSCRPFVVITLSTGLVGVEVTSVAWLEQLTVGV